MCNEDIARVRLSDTYYILYMSLENNIKVHEQILEDYGALAKNS